MNVEKGQKWRTKDGKHVITIHGLNKKNLSVWNGTDELGDIYFLTDEQIREYCERVMTIDLDELERLAKDLQRSDGVNRLVAFQDAANPETVLALVQRVRELEQGLNVIRDECDAAVKEAEFREGGSKGMQVPYHGPFAAGLRLPSVVRDLRQQRAFVDRVLAGESHD